MKNGKHNHLRTSKSSRRAGKIFKTPEKISSKELKRQNKQMGEQLSALQQRQRDNFNLLFLLAVNLYQIQPDHDIFTNGTFKEEFIEMIKKSVQAKAEAAEKNKKS